MNANVYIGTVGMGVWFSRDSGETWNRPTSVSGLPTECRVWSLASHPDRPGQLLAGSDVGVRRWDEAERRWSHLPSDLDGFNIWTLEHDPRDPDVVMAGVQPGGLYRSEDGGRSWRRLDLPFADICMPLGVIPRATAIVYDPIEPDLIWVGVEIDGVWRSDDRGATWRKTSEGLVSDDIHDLTVLVVDGRRRLLATTNKGLHRSDDDGASWRLVPLDSPAPYCRLATQRADRDGTVFVGNGNGPPGDMGLLFRSRDAGGTWERLPLPAELNSTAWRLATHPADPDLMFMCTNLGQIFRSRDGGDSWQKLRRELGEIRACVWRPAA